MIRLFLCSALALVSFTFGAGSFIGEARVFELPAAPTFAFDALDLVYPVPAPSPVVALEDDTAQACPVKVAPVVVRHFARGSSGYRATC